MKVLRIFHAGRNAAHRERDRALVRAGAELTLIVPSAWPEAEDVHEEPFEIVQLPVRRPGNVNRHVYADAEALDRAIRGAEPDVVDLHEEPFSDVTHQVLRRLDPSQRVVGYTAQNIDKRLPPPYVVWERQALARLDGLYPCSRQAASVAVGKGFRGAVRVLPLAPPSQMTPGAQTPPTGGELNLLLVGRLVPQKGVTDAVRVLAATRHLGGRLRIVGEGPEDDAARALAHDLGVADRLEILPWLDAAALAACYQEAHVLLAPSVATRTWVEQFGRMVVEAQACGAVVAAYASGSLPEVVGAAGVLVPEGDSDALGKAVARLAVEPATWARLRGAGLVAAAECTWAAVARGQLDLYELAMAGASHRSTRTQRIAARATWGMPALEGARPVALPVLRDHDGLNRAVGAAIDVVSRRDRSVATTRRLKVVYVDHVARMSGGEIALLRLISALDGAVDAHVILGEDGPLRAALEQAGATVEVLPMADHARNLRRAGVGASRAAAGAAISTAAYTLRLARRLRALRPDLVHTNSLKSGYYGTLAARWAGVPVLWHVRDRIADDYLPRPVVRLTRAALRVLPTAVLANSRTTLETTALRTGHVVHDPFAAVGPAGEPPPGLRVGIVGRLADWKGQDIFLRALAELAPRYPDLTGVIVGSAMFGEESWESELRALAADLGLTSRVTFTGHVSDVDAQLRRLAVLVHASTIPEPFGQVIVEGLAVGVPVIATAGGGPSEILTDGVDGLLVPAGDAPALAQALRRLIDDDDLRRRLRRNGPVRAADFSPARIADETMAAYDATVS